MSERTQNPVKYDVVFYDRVGMPFVGSTLRSGGLGGSELQTILVAEELAKCGKSVLVANNAIEHEILNGVTYVPWIVAHSVETDVLLICRYSTIPPIKYRKRFVVAMDMPGDAYGHLRGISTITLTRWHSGLFPGSIVIPPMLPESIRTRRSRISRRFIYASAVLKGLKETLAMWEEIAPADAELVITNPGYDVASMPALPKNVRFLGVLPGFDDVVEEIAKSEGMFFVNVFPECAGFSPTIAESTGIRTHVLCLNGKSGLADMINSSLLTTSREDFVRDFQLALETPNDPKWRAEPKDFRPSSISPQWLALFERKKSTLCLSMIVKNEAHVIERCLDSVLPIIDSWCIVDTGSTDGTQDIIRKKLESVPGKLFQSVWRDFATNRNEALALVDADYALVIDADDVLDGTGLPELTADVYDLSVHDSTVEYWRPHIFRPHFQYTGVLHEYLDCGHSRTRIDGLIYRRICDGSRSQDPEKFKKDAATLEKALLDDPNNDRYVFYLAQSYKDAGDLQRACDTYERRAAMGGFAEEVFVSLLELAKATENMGNDPTSAYLRAYENRPTRAEPLYWLARYLRLKNRFVIAAHFAEAALYMPRPDDLLFVEADVYAWKVMDEFAISAYYAGKYQESRNTSARLLAHAPPTERTRIQTNLDFAIAKT